MMKKRTIAIVAGGDSSELVVSLRSAQGIYSFIDKERYNLYIVEMQGKRWEVVLPNGEKTPIDRNDFSFIENGEKKNFDFAYITIHGTPGENGILQGYDLIWKGIEITSGAQREHRAEEIKTQTCIVGPHRDDYIFYLNDVNIINRASQGQIKTFAICSIILIDGFFLSPFSK